MKRILISILPLVILAGCNEENGVSSTPPFNDFWHSTRFTYTIGASTFNSLQYYNVHAKFSGSLSNEYQFQFQDATEGVVPEGAKLTLTASGADLTITSFGQMERTGEMVPIDYTGDPGLWNTQSISYEIIVTINTDTKQIQKGSFIVQGATFNASQDITSLLRFSEINDGSTWSIGKQTSAAIIGGADIRFTIDL